MKKDILFTFIILCLNSIVAQAQEAVTASGGDAIGSGGSLSYSYGQIVFTTNTDSSESLAQGVQQAYDISVVHETEKTKDITLSCSVYPNPSGDFLKLKIDNFENKNFSYKLYEASGKYLDAGEVTQSITTINMVDYAAACYFLRVLQDGQHVKTFKIIKT